MKLVKKIINRWLSICVPAVTNDIPDYDGYKDYEAEVLIYDQIGEDYFGGKGIDAATFKTSLDSVAGKKTLVRIHSPGGNVYDAMAMTTAIKEHGKADTKVDGIAASAAFSIFQAGKNRIMSNFSMGMIHKASSLMIGNSKDMANEARILSTHDEAIAKMLSARSGKSVESCMNMMDKETWMTAEDCISNGMADELTDDNEPEDKAQSKFDLSRFKNVPERAARFNNSVNNKTIPMNRAQMIALLKAQNIIVADDASDDWLISETRLTLQNNAVPGSQPAPESSPKSSVIDLQARIAQLEDQNVAIRKSSIVDRVNKCIENDQCPANKKDWLIAIAMLDEQVLATFEALSPRPPGIAPVSQITIEKTAPEDLVKGFRTNRQVLDAGMRGMSIHDRHAREEIGAGAKATGRICRQYIRQLVGDDKRIGTEGYEEQRRNKIADFLEAVAPRDGRAPSIAQRMNATTNYDGVSVDTLLGRQVIMSEAMRAFRRVLWPIESFAHYFGNVPLQGTDQIVVPYYPLFTTQSLRFVQGTGVGQGYQSNGNDAASQKNITVGGVGGTVKTAGIDRAYQPMTWSAYLLRRQPWVDILKLVTMRTEQLALDVLTDITVANILKANFGTSVWQGTPSGFDSTAIAALRGIADKKYWPAGMRNLVILTDYYVNALVDPYLKAYLNVGDTGVIRDGRIGGVYGFSDTIGNPIIPATGDGDLVGWISYPSAVLVATSPILPAPGELKLMVSYDVVTDDQIDLSFEYKYFGQPIYSQDFEIIECNYGSGLGELAALGRITNGGV
jgi:ATP-dependent protease ClpP protease subunit